MDKWITDMFPQKTKIQKKQERKILMTENHLKIIKRIAIAVVAFILLNILNPIVIVGSGHRGVVTTFGSVENRILQEGFNFKIPIAQRVTEIDVRIQKFEVLAPAASYDLQEVSSEIALNFHISPDKVNLLYQTVGVEEFQNKIIEPMVQEIVKSITAKYTAVDLIQKRQIVANEIEKELKEKLEPYYITIDQVSMKDFDFSEKFKAAIEDKQEAEQLALKAQRDLERIKTEAEQQIATARAEAESYRLKNSSITPIMRDMEWIKKWDGRLPQVQGSNTPMIQIPSQGK